jgi:hypothetical protein
MLWLLGFGVPSEGVEDAHLRGKKEKEDNVWMIATLDGAIVGTFEDAESPRRYC